MTDLPAPPVPADCDLRDMDGFMLNVERLLASELWALSDGSSFKAAVALWCRSWKQIPAASLPDDDAVIAAFAGVSVPMLRKNRAVILRGFIKCSDGRLYHKTLAEDAVRSMAAKQRRKEAKEAEAERLRTYRERKKNGDQNGDRTGERTPYEQSAYGTRQDRDRTGTGQGQGLIKNTPPTPEGGSRAPVADEHDLGTPPPPSDPTPPRTNADRWRFEVQSNPWAQALVRVVKIGPENWPKWEGILADLFAGDYAELVKFARTLTVERWPETIEAEWRKRRPDATATANGRKAVIL
jgi:uncharacterized protein YdaU (DUF1376 family)